jgi:DNA processing protein
MLSLFSFSRIKVIKTCVDNQELRCILALCQLPGIGHLTARTLVNKFGTAAEVFKQTDLPESFRKTVGESLRNAPNDRGLWKRIDDELRFAEKYQIRLLTMTDEGFPARLNDCKDAPLFVFYKGNADLNNQRVVGIVGTRSATDYGKLLARELVVGLRETGVLVVSGLAFGIDSCAHRAALDCGLETVGVLGHGLDRIYPQNNKTMAQRMIGQGGLLTEFFSGTKPDRENFPQRNRILAGLCDTVIVVEAGPTGGALVTADIAVCYNRMIYAVPGRTTDPYSRGCNMLLKLKKADIIRSAEDLINDFSWKQDLPELPKTMTRLFIPLTRDEETIVNLLQNEGELAVDEIVRKTGIPPGMTAAALLSLEIDQVVRCRPGKVYRIS